MLLKLEKTTRERKERLDSSETVYDRLLSKHSALASGHLRAEAEVELKNDKLRRKLNAKEALIIESACQHKAQVESSKAAIRADALSPRGTIRTVKLSKGEADPRPEGGFGEVYEGAQRA